MRNWPRCLRFLRAPTDGLRAIAVLSVVLFHLKAGMLAGGFAGVDVFFGISEPGSFSGVTEQRLKTCRV